MKDRRKAEQLANALAISCRTKQQRARLWLVLFLADEPQLARDVLLDGHLMGFSETTIRRASQGIIQKLHAPLFAGQWRWELLKPLKTVGMNPFWEWAVARLSELIQ